jgi:hypothetical protein
LFRRRFEGALSGLDAETERGVLAIMIYEDFNRPRLVRWFERRFKRDTVSIMQVKGVPTDYDSVIVTARYLEPQMKEWVESGRETYGLNSVFQRHNPDDYTYAQRVVEIFRDLDFRH